MLMLFAFPAGWHKAMNLSQSLHGSILFQEAKGLPESDLGLFSLLFLFCFENAMAMFQRVHGVTPESEWPPALRPFLWTFSFCFCFKDTTALFKSVLGPFSLLFLFLFLFWGCNGPVPKRVHGATPKSPWPPPALAAWPACGPSAAPWQRLRSATSHGISASCPLGKICWLKTRGHLVTVLESFSI